jgi:hypothetical protein
VYPPPDNDANATTPFFTATVQPVRWAPSFPFNNKALVTNPPVPASGKDGEEEVRASGGKDGSRWASTAMAFVCKKAKLARVDVVQPGQDMPDVASWWPAVKPFKFGLFLENAQFDLAAAEFFE